MVKPRQPHEAVDASTGLSYELEPSERATQQRLQRRIQLAHTLKVQGIPREEICRLLGIKKRAYYRYLRRSPL